MFNKQINLTVTKDDYEILDNEFIKTASEVILPDGYDYDPDFLYIKVRAISAGENYGCNKNGDFFPEEELKNNYKTFLDAHVFKNHENKAVEKAIGDVMDAVWNDEMKYVELFIRINRKVAPTIVAGFEKGYMTDVSMGCRVDHTICSICGNVAKTPSQYCQHIRQHKHEILEDGRKVFEINIAPKFHDISAVLNGADRTAKMTAMFVSPEKKAFLENQWGMSKVASFSKNDNTSDRFSNFLSQENSPEDTAMQKIASEYCIQEFDTPLFEKRASSQTTMEKIAEIKKRIKGNVLRVARSRQEIKDNNACCEQVEKEMCSNAVMSLEQMDKIGKKVLEIASEERISPIKVLNMFFKLSLLSGRTFSPSETVGLMKRVTKCSDTSTCLSQPSFADGDCRPLLNRIFEQSDYCKMDLGLNRITEILGRIFGGIHHNPGLDVRCSEPMTKGRVMIIRMSTSPNMINENEISQPSIIRRIIRLANEINSEEFEKLASETQDEVAQNYDYEFYTRAPFSIASAIEKIAYSTYLNEMEKYANSKDFGFDMENYGDELEKVAAPAIFSAIGPGIGTLALARYEGTKAREGQPLSTIERAMAENPEVSAGVAALAGYNVKKFTNKAKGLLSENAKIKKRRLKYKIANEDFNLIDELLNMEKVASIDYQNQFEENLDIFKNEGIDDYLVKQGYTQNEVNNIKLATTLYAYERQDVCDNVLKQANLGYNDIENFLKVAIDYAELGLEKTAKAGRIGKALNRYKELMTGSKDKINSLEDKRRALQRIGIKKDLEYSRKMNDIKTDMMLKAHDSKMDKYRKLNNDLDAQLEKELGIHFSPIEEPVKKNTYESDDFYKKEFGKLRNKKARLNRSIGNNIERTSKALQDEQKAIDTARLGTASVIGGTGLVGGGALAYKHHKNKERR